MHRMIQHHYEKAMAEFTSLSYHKTMVEAKEEYFNLTGLLHEDEEDYEIKMNAFNDWYMLSYISQEGGPFMKIYLEKNDLEDELYDVFMRCNYSLFEYVGKNFRGAYTFKDILHSTKVSLAKDHRPLSMLKHDLVIGRIIKYKNKFYFLNGMTFLPAEVRPLLAKESKKVRRAIDPHQEYEFLTGLEKMKTTYSRFGHVDPLRFFTFQS